MIFDKEEVSAIVESLCIHKGIDYSSISSSIKKSIRRAFCAC